ncbi:MULTISPECIES: hypothetical protein [unclassified Rickettsia]|uniref:hypothetical protein n=1 Tax=unclassified Rickettsia TaxID=114295 RepID=UPI003132B8B9
MTSKIRAMQQRRRQCSRGYRNRHCEEGRSPGAAIQKIIIFIAFFAIFFSRLPRRCSASPRNDGVRSSHTTTPNLHENDREHT